MVKASEYASSFLSNEITIFAPTDRAVKAFTETNGGAFNKETFVLNHMGIINITMKLKVRKYNVNNYYFAVNVQVQIGSQYQIGRITRVGSMLPASPPLWITKDGSDSFVNGAKIVMRNLKATSDIGKRRQVNSPQYTQFGQCSWVLEIAGLVTLKWLFPLICYRFYISLMTSWPPWSPRMTHTRARSSTSQPASCSGVRMMSTTSTDLTSSKQSCTKYWIVN